MEKIYQNIECGNILTESEMLKEFAELYDGNDPTNCISWDEYYRVYDGDNTPSDPDEKMENLKKQYRKEYEFLYENQDNVAGAREATEEFDRFAKSNKTFIQNFVNYIGDFIASDREAAAFMFAVNELYPEMI